MKNAAIYARVSSDRQKEENTIASQTAALKKFAHTHGFIVPEEWVFEDDGYSGASLVRPGLEKIRDLAAEGPIQTVLVYSPDRPEPQVCISSTTDRRVRPLWRRYRVYQGAAVEHAGRPASFAVPRHDR